MPARRHRCRSRPKTMLPAANLNTAAELAKNSITDFILIHQNLTFAVHARVLSASSGKFFNLVRNGISTYEIKNNDIDMGLLIECLYCYADEIDFTSTTWHQFITLMEEMSNLKMKFQFKSTPASFIYEMILAHSWFKGMSLADKHLFHELVSKCKDDVVVSTEHSLLPTIYPWAKDTRFFHWESATFEMCRTRISKVRELEAHHRRNYQSYTLLWRIYKEIDMPCWFVLDLPLDQIHQIYNYSVDFWVLVRVELASQK